MQEKHGKPILYKKLNIPEELLTTSKDEDGNMQTYGGDVRIGDLDGDDQVDFLIFRNTDGTKPVFMAAFNLDGRILWKVGDDGLQPVRPGPAAIHDIDADGKTEVICLFHNPDIESKPDELKDVVVQIRSGQTGEVKKEAAPPELTNRSGSGPNWVHQRILLANFRGNEKPRDFVIKLGDTLVAFDDDLNVLWKYTTKWNEYGKCSAYIPSVGDINGDGKDEVNGGYYLISAEGDPLWEKQLGWHMDSVAITQWDKGNMRAICSGFGHVMDHEGNVILKLSEEIVPHGQEARVANFLPDSEGPEMIIRYNAHNTDVIVVSNKGEVLRKFNLNYSPNNTGMEVVYWNGPDKAAILYNGGMLFDGYGNQVYVMPELPEPVGPSRMGWYHCIPADVCGDKREELVLYNPWDRYIYIYTPEPLDPEKFSGYRPEARQYNPRLMD
ncbi:hypothetical protein GF312_01480 [Candidatus Poribacteria bacterium]|nr:hypothetical protein [Candidatus Poribacteria bacterium]